MQPGTKTARFPRLISGNAARALKMLWQEPKRSVTIPKKRNAVVFKFRIPIHEQLRKEYPELYEPFFGAGRAAWRKAISDAYDRAKWGDKSVSKLLPNILRVVYRDAIDIWYAETLAMVGNVELRESNLKASAPGAHTKKSQPDLSVALWVTNRLATLMPGIKEVRRADKAKHLSETRLAEKMRVCIPSAVTPEDALNKLYGKNCDRSTSVSRFSIREIAEAYIRLEMHQSSFKSHDHNFNSYIRMMRKIRQQLSELTIIG